MDLMALIRYNMIHFNCMTSCMTQVGNYKVLLYNTLFSNVCMFCNSYQHLIFIFS